MFLKPNHPVKNLSQIFTLLFVVNVIAANLYLHFSWQPKMDQALGSEIQMWSAANRLLGFSNYWFKFSHLHQKEIEIKVEQKSETGEWKNKTLSNRQLKGVWHNYILFSNPEIANRNSACYFCDSQTIEVQLKTVYQHDSVEKSTGCRCR